HNTGCIKIRNALGQRPANSTQPVYITCNVPVLFYRKDNIPTDVLFNYFRGGVGSCSVEMH
ncbi:MAG: hypothetical protein ABF370_08855, partial [Verrucomicrobiales bacterium]